MKFSIMSECEQMFAVKLLPFMPSKEELIAEIEHARGRTAIRKRKPEVKRLKRPPLFNFQLQLP